jgi:hypothetical protein
MSKTAAEWQELLDSSFPEGSFFSAVTADGLSPRGMIPVLVVMAMDGDVPLVAGIRADGLDVQLRISSWEEIDRDGHFVARVKDSSGGDGRVAEFELSSWLTPAAVAEMATVRESQREWLSQVAQSAVAEDPGTESVVPAET